MLNQALNNSKHWGWLLDDGNYENDWDSKEVDKDPLDPGAGKKNCILHKRN